VGDTPLIPQADEGSDVNNELANRMSLFYANATPMLKTLSDGTTKFVADVRWRVSRAPTLPYPAPPGEVTHHMVCSSTRRQKMFTAVSDWLVGQNPDVPIENTTDCLSTMACVCKVMLETP